MFIVDGQFVTDGHAPGIETEMDGGLWVSESPWPPLKGGSSKSRGQFRPDIAVESPTARWLCKGYRLWVIGYRMGVFGTVVVEGAAAAPERPNNKKDDAHVLHELCLRNLN